MFTKACDFEGDTVTQSLSQKAKLGPTHPVHKCDLPRMTPNSEHKFGTSTSVTKVGSQLAKLGRNQIRNPICPTIRLYEQMAIAMTVSFFV